jgi:hypothetical protein
MAMLGVSLRSGDSELARFFERFRRSDIQIRLGEDRATLDRLRAL